MRKIGIIQNGNGKLMKYANVGKKEKKWKIENFDE